MNSSRLPILTCSEAKEFEDHLFQGSPNAAENAMTRAGQQLGIQLAEDVQAFIQDEETPGLILLLGKGNNSGDALYAALAFAELWPDTRVSLLCCWNPNTWSDPLKRAFDSLKTRVEVIDIFDLNSERDLQGTIRKTISNHRCPIVLDGIFGMSFQAPLRGIAQQTLRLINASPDIRLRVSVDIPSGIGDTEDPDCFVSDLTYATGILKTPCAEASPNVIGRLKLIDLDFFREKAYPHAKGVVSSRIFNTRPRPSSSDKRTFGHVFILAGSHQMPGALIMATAAAIRSGAGLVTVCAPAHICHTASIQLPEAMWIPAPVSENGTLDERVKHLFFKHSKRATTILMGPGMGRAPETQDLLEAVILESEGFPLVIDADALQPRIIQALVNSKSRRPGTILTPHAGELERISSGTSVEELSEKVKGVIISKGPRTWVHTAERATLIPFGNPVLARGGSGDILAGLVAGSVASNSENLEGAACYAASLHGRAADRLSKVKGEKHVATTDLLKYI